MKRLRTETFRMALLMVGLSAVVLMLVLSPAMGQDTAAEPTVTQEPGTISLWTTVKSGGFIGFIIVVLSCVSVALVVEHFFTLRREKLIPKELVHELEGHFEGKRYDEAEDACERDGSYLGQVCKAGLGQIGAMFGFFDMQNAMQEVSERAISKLYRKLEYLTFIAASAPMLGLLGTVTGMIESFNQIAQTEGAAKPSQLAGGISEALVTTCMGLIVAIPTMFFVSFFRNRIDGYVAEAEAIVEKLMGQFRKTGAE